MPYLIDGHNLIGQMRDISLSDPQDEERLVGLLAAWCDRRGASATVYFDRGAPGSGPTRRGRLTARFVRPPRTADAAIEDHLRRLGRDAPQWTVVSSDREVRRAAQRAGARTVESAEFAASLRLPAPGPGSEKPEIPSQEEVKAWLREFRRGRRS